MFLQNKKVIDGEVSCQIHTQFLESNLLPDIHHSKKVGLSMGVSHFYEIQGNTLWAKMNVYQNIKWWKIGGNPVKYKVDYKNWSYCKTFNMLTNLILVWYLQVSMTFSKIQTDRIIK
jgi:hypothetical protein